MKNKLAIIIVLTMVLGAFSAFALSTALDAKKESNPPVTDTPDVKTPPAPVPAQPPANKTATEVKPGDKAPQADTKDAAPAPKKDEGKPAAEDTPAKK